MTYQGAALTFADIQRELADADHNVRKEAIRKLIRYQREVALQPLLELLQDARSDVRMRAVQALGQLKDKRALEPLQALLKDRSASVRVHVIGVLGSSGERNLAPELHYLLKDPGRRLRQAAARALGQLRNPVSLPPLLAYLPQAENAELIYLVPAICDFDLPEVIMPLLALCEADRTRLGSIATGLARLGAGSTPLLLQLLADPQTSPITRQGMIISLRLQPRQGSVPYLLQALEDSDADVRSYAVSTLGCLQGIDVRKWFVRALSDACSSVRWSAIYALSKLEPEPSAIDPLTACLSSASGLEVEFATRELARLQAFRAVRR